MILTIVPFPPPILVPSGVHVRQRPQPTVPHHHMQKNPPTPWQLDGQPVAPKPVGVDVGATAVCVPVWSALVKERKTIWDRVFVPLMTTSPGTTVDSPKKADEDKVGEEWDFM